MRIKHIRGISLAPMLALLLATVPGVFAPAVAQQQAPAADQQQQASAQDTEAPQTLSDEEMQVLVARIALYPDELVAVITAASLYPLQIVEAERFLEKRKTDKNLKPKDDWDGSVVSLLNYPEIVKMMSTDLDWTQSLGEAITNQQKDVLVAIQQLREEAQAKGIIKSDDKVKVTKEDDKIVIQPANKEVVYVPQYEPQMLYDPGYVAAPVSYYPEPYPPYYYPTAPFFAGFVTGAIWGAVVDWNNWGVWGGRWGNNIDIDCNNCFNNRKFNGKMKWNDVDWKNVDRSKIKFNKGDFTNINRNQLKGQLEASKRNNLSDRGRQLERGQRETARSGNRQVKDVRKSTLEGLKQKPRATNKRAGANKTQRTGAKSTNRKASKQRATKTRTSRQASKPRAGTRVDNRPRNPSGLGDVRSYQRSRMDSNRGYRSMSGARSRGHVQPRASRGGRGGRR